MEASQKQFWFKLGLISLLTVVIYAPVLYFNFVLDPEGIFRTSDVGQRVLPNERFIKMRLLLTHPAAYDGILFGSSRVDHIDVSSIPNFRVYNATMSGGDLEDYADNLQRLLANDNSLKLVLLGVDDVSYTGDLVAREHSFSLASYPATRWKRFIWMIRYLLHVPARDYAQHVLRPKDVLRFDLYHSGQYFADEADARITAHPLEHLADREKFPERLNLASRTTRIDQAIAALQKIITLCNSHGIRLVVFTNPPTMTVWRSLNWNAHENFLRALGQNISFWDFSGINSVTTNNLNYYENSHYRNFIGEAMLQVMFNVSGTRVYPDFGTLVTPQNLETHLTRLHHDFDQANASSSQSSAL